jgi:uncharacterized protein YkwD
MICRWSRRLSVLVAACVRVGIPLFVAADDGGMTPQERAVLDELNLARTRPAEYASYVEEHKKNYKGPGAVLVDGRKFRTAEGVRAVDEAVAFLRSATPLAPLSDATPLVRSARGHAHDIGPRGMTGHAGTDGSQPPDRIAQFGTPRSTSGEAIAFGSVSPRLIVVQLIVDDGVPDRGHRNSVFNPAFRMAGVAIGAHKGFDYLCVINFSDEIEEKPTRR